MDKLYNYAELIVCSGVNVQKGQSVVVNCPVTCADFAHALCKAAYAHGAGECVVFWKDETLERMDVDFALEEALSTCPQWVVERSMYYVGKGACFISVHSSDPDAMKGADPTRANTARRAVRSALKEFNSYLMADRARWCVASVPSEAWARKVFPTLGTKEAMDRLMECILSACRADAAESIKAWAEHTDGVVRHVKALNARAYDSLHFVSSNGTDLIVPLAQGHIWCGGVERDTQGVPFSANIPSEEIFTAPHRLGTCGRAVATKPLNYGGTLIEDFWFEFREGKVTDFGAASGREALALLLESDEGASHIGEVALVPWDSPIAQSGILFYNTLFDENAACHLALGEAYETCVGGEDRSENALREAGLNRSLIHVDFMIGSADMTITGVKDGVESAVFTNGIWA